MAYVAFQGFLNIDGISGGSADPGHVGWSDLESFDYEMAQASVGPVGDPAAGQIRFADFTAVKVLDRASPKIYEACCNGHLIKNVVVELWWGGERRLDDERRLEVGSLFPRPANAGERDTRRLTIKMDDVIIIRVRAGSYCQEAVSFSCAKVVWTYTQEGADGVAADNVTFGWNLPGGRATDWGTAACRSMVSCVR